MVTSRKQETEDDWEITPEIRERTKRGSERARLRREKLLNTTAPCDVCGAIGKFVRYAGHPARPAKLFRCDNNHEFYVVAGR